MRAVPSPMLLAVRTDRRPPQLPSCHCLGPAWGCLGVPQPCLGVPGGRCPSPPPPFLPAFLPGTHAYMRTPNTRTHEDACTRTRGAARPPGRTWNLRSMPTPPRSGAEHSWISCPNACSCTAITSSASDTARSAGNDSTASATAAICTGSGSGRATRGMAQRRQGASSTVRLQRRCASRLAARSRHTAASSATELASQMRAQQPCGVQAAAAAAA